MTADTIGLKVNSKSTMTKAITIIRKYSNSSIGEIKRSIQEKRYVLLYPYTDRFGLKKIIACYEELEHNGVGAKVYELDDELTTIEFLKNLNGTYDEISEEIESEI